MGAEADMFNSKLCYLRIRSTLSMKGHSQAHILTARIPEMMEFIILTR